MVTAGSDIRDQFEAVFRQHYNSLCSYAFAFLKDETGSEDIVQDIFIKIWEQRRDLLVSGQWKYYAFTAVRNNCLTAIAKNKKMSVAGLVDGDIRDEVSLFIEKDERGADPKVLIAKAMDQLPPKCREVFMLSRLSGQTYQQIADSLDISVKTVENQMGKAIKILKIFAKEHSIYLMMTCYMAFEKDLVPAIGIIIGKLFYS